MDTLDISDETEQMLQDAHDDEFVYVAPRRFYVERCVTCNDAPLWGCSLWPCSDTQSCFIVCPTCGQYGFNDKPEQWVADEALATLLLQKMGR